MQQLDPYQAHDAARMARMRAAYAAHEPGAGKTAIGINAALQADPRAPWFVCTMRDAKDQWHRELAAWAPGKKNVVVTHYEEAHRLMNAGINSGVVLVDEISRCRNALTDAWRALYPVCCYARGDGHVKHVYGLDGTPVHNGPADLVAQLVLLGVYRVEDYHQAVVAFGDPQLNGFGGRIDARGASNLDQLRQVLHQVLIRRTYADMLVDMPPLAMDQVPCSVDTSPAGRLYQAARADFSTWYTATQGMAAPPLARYTTLRRMMALARLDQVGARVAGHLAAGRRVLVFSEFREPVEQLHGRFKGSGLVLGGDSPGARGQVVAAARDGKGAGALFATTSSLGVAHNLQAFDVVAFVDLGFTPADFDQAFKRAWRRGRKSPVQLERFFFAGDPLEKFVRDVLLRKEEILAQLGLLPSGNLTQFDLAA